MFLPLLRNQREPPLSHILTHNKNHWLPVLPNRPAIDGAPKTDGQPTRTIAVA
jgi:hypothetical protein